MDQRLSPLLFLAIAALAALVPASLAAAPALSSPATEALRYLERVMDQYRDTVDVYTDADSPGNHFFFRGRMFSGPDSSLVPVMDERWRGSVHSGSTSIRASLRCRTDNWGGWYFLNGVLGKGAVAPDSNWGSVPGAGIDLRGMKHLRFWARGERGGERVEFFCLGVGRDATTGRRQRPFPDSSPVASTGVLSLGRGWTEYTIPLAGRDLSYVLGGFGWAAGARQNRYRDVTFYLDDIRYEPGERDRAGARPELPGRKLPQLLRSYEPAADGGDFDRVIQNAAFTYDNAVALIAFEAAGDTSRSRRLGDALVYAQQRDRFFRDDRVRNAYQAGDLPLSPGWVPGERPGDARLPGWYDPWERSWFEDRTFLGTSSGNAAWAMLALLALSRHPGGERYVAAAETLGIWVRDHCRSGGPLGGFSGGVEGFDVQQEALGYRSTEHNLDLLVAFDRLAAATQRAEWRGQSSHARRFVAAMWDSTAGHFWTGTDEGDHINRTTVPLDVQAWAIQALGASGIPFARAVDFVESNHRVRDGFDFNDDKDGAWYEGTAQMVVTYRLLRRTSEADWALSRLRAAQLASGALPTTDRSTLTTGLHLSNGCPWLYFRRPHVGATAWFVLAELGVNPFWFPGAAP